MLSNELDYQCLLRIKSAVVNLITVWLDSKTKLITSKQGQALCVLTVVVVVVLVTPLVMPALLKVLEEEVAIQVEVEVVAASTLVVLAVVEAIWMTSIPMIQILQQEVLVLHQSMDMFNTNFSVPLALPMHLALYKMPLVLIQKVCSYLKQIPHLVAMM